MITSSISVPNITLSTPLSNILSLCFSLNVKKQISHPQKTGKINKTCLARENIFTRICAAVSDENKQFAINFTLLIMPIQSSFSSLHTHTQFSQLDPQHSPTHSLTHSHQTAAVQSGMAQFGTSNLNSRQLHISEHQI